MYNMCHDTIYTFPLDVSGEECHGPTYFIQIDRPGNSEILLYGALQVKGAMKIADASRCSAL